MSGRYNLEGTTLRERAGVAIANTHVRRAIQHVTDKKLATGRESGYGSLDNTEVVRDAARTMRADIVSRLPEILATLADNAERAGTTVHWATDAAEANQIITDLVRSVSGEQDRGTGKQAPLVVKSKSMLTEEIGLNDALEADGIEVVETDLGEWIIQLAGQTPSHIIAPAIHLTAGDVADIFNRISDGDLSDVPDELCAFARDQLRQKFLAADVGISGCNVAVAETGTIGLFMNEGNGRMVTTLPPVHIAVMGMERVVETWDQFDLQATLLPRAATGQEITVYHNQITGTRRTGELDGPDSVHLVIVDNGRSDLLGTEYAEMLNCIRCGACLNACPVYRQIGGHSYGSCYSGPMGAVLNPLLNETPEAAELADASTLCGACHEACPVRIPLQDMLLALRRRRVADGSLSSGQQAAWRAWAEAWSRPRTYRWTTNFTGRAQRVVPAAVVPPSWGKTRDLPSPAGPPFRQWMQDRR